MIAVTSPGFVLFAALLAGLWYACPPPRRWQLLLGANLLFYAVLCPAALPVLAGSSFLVWWCGRRTAKKPVPVPTSRTFNFPFSGRCFSNSWNHFRPISSSNSFLRTVPKSWDRWVQ